MVVLLVIENNTVFFVEKVMNYLFLRFFLSLYENPIFTESYLLTASSFCYVISFDPGLLSILK